VRRDSTPPNSNNGNGDDGGDRDKSGAFIIFTVIVMVLKMGKSSAANACEQGQYSTRNSNVRRV
jgi:hypothetical protein